MQSSDFVRDTPKSTAMNGFLPIYWNIFYWVPSIKGSIAFGPGIQGAFLLFSRPFIIAPKAGGMALKTLHAMKKKKETKSKKESLEGKTFYAVVLETIGDPEYTCMDENGNPWLFLSEAAAWKDVADTMISCLTEFIKGNRSFHETDFNSDMHVIPVQARGGCIIGESDGYELVHVITPSTAITFEGEEPGDMDTHTDRGG